MTPLVRRCLFAAAGGAVAALGLIALPAHPPWCAGLECFLPDLVLVPVALVTAALLAWGVLALGRVPQSWLVALVGPLTVLAMVTTAARLLSLDSPDLPGKALFLGTVELAYVAAAVVTADTVRTAWRVAVGLPMVVLFGWGVLAPIVAAAF